eukprot:2762616-Amphidinium_carterae.1
MPQLTDDLGVPDMDGWHLQPPFAGLNAMEVELGPGDTSCPTSKGGWGEWPHGPLVSVLKVRHCIFRRGAIVPWGWCCVVTDGIQARRVIPASTQSNVYDID